MGKLADLNEFMKLTPAEAYRKYGAGKEGKRGNTTGVATDVGPNMGKVNKGEDFSKRISASDRVGPNLSSPTRGSPSGEVGADMGKVNKPDVKPAPKKDTTFGEAFKTARKAGKDTFTFKGKSYTTETASKDTSKPAPKKETPSGNIGATTGVATDIGPKMGAAKVGAAKVGDVDYSGLSRKATPEDVRKVERDSWEDPHEQARRVLGHGSSNYKKGGSVKCMSKGGSASGRGDGCAVRGKTKGRMV